MPPGPRAGRAAEQGLELRDVEIVARGHAFESVTAEEIISRPRIRDVQRKIAALPIAGEEREVIVVADEVAVGRGGADLLENPFLAGFEDTRRGDPDAAGIFELGRAEVAARGIAISDF